MTYYLALGSNKGDRLAALRKAVAQLSEGTLIRVIQASPVYENAAHTLEGQDEQPDFLNAVIEIETSLRPSDLLAHTQEIERGAGRSAKAEEWAPRELDIDLLICNGKTVATADLSLPHPRLGERRFVLQPLADLDPDLHIPAPYHSTVAELLARCADKNPLRRTLHTLI